MSDEARMAGEPLEEEASAEEEPSAAPFPTLPALLVAAAIVLAAVLGAPVHLRAPAVVTLAPVAAVMAVLALRKPLHAALTAGLATVAGLMTAYLVAEIPLASTGSTAAGEALVAGAVAAGVAFAACLALERAERLRGVLAAAALALVVASMWFAVVQSATTPAEDGTTFAGMLSAAPAPGPGIPIQGAYLGLVDRLRTGGPYYATAADVLEKANAAYERPDDLTAPLALPAPALYLTLSRLPAGGIWILLAALVCGTAATGGAYLLASRYASTQVALASASAVAGYFAAVGLRVSVLDAEPWAGGFGLLALGLLAASLDADRGATALGWAAAVTALAAALLREPAAVFLVLGLAATLVDADARGRRAWAPWAVGCLGAAVAIGAHARAAASAVSALAPQASAVPVPTGVPHAFQGIASVLGVAAVVVWVLALLGIAGAVLGPRTQAARLALAGSLLAGAATFFVLPANGGGTIAPTLLACVPLVLVAVPSGPAEDAPEVAD